MYLIMVDRFENAASDDFVVDSSDPHGWHGGDLAGIEARLDHLDHLGVGTVWLTPIADTRDDKVGEWGAFHGYWTHDPTRLEPRFGTRRDLQSLARALHDRQQRLVLDMVWNHTDYDAPVRQSHPDWFHDNGDITDWNDPVQRVRGDVHGLPDLAQENPQVRAWLRRTSEAWIDTADVDGLRIDAVGHMPRSFLRWMNDSLDAHARARRGGTGIWTLAEDFTGDPIALAATRQEGHFDAIFDFATHYAMVDVACREAPPWKLGAALSLDRYGPPASARVTFLDNHDLPRVAHVCGLPDHPEQALARIDAALLLLFATRGTPCLTWGTEALLDGGEEPANRASMPWEHVGRRSDLIGSLQQLREQHPALSGPHSQVVSADAHHVRVLRWSDTEVAILDVVADGVLPKLSPEEWGGDAVLSSVVVPVSAVTETDPYAQAARVDLSPDPTQGRPTTDWNGPLSAQPGRARLVVLDRIGALPDVAEAPQPHTLQVAITGAPRGAELRVVGASPELGAWNPAAAPVAEWTGGVPTVRVVLRDGDVVPYKAVLVDASGAVIWSAAPDSVAFLDPRTAVTTVHAPWRDDNSHPPR